VNNPFCITTSIPYVNAPPHLGFALELVQADVLARYHRLCGHAVRFQTGTDENAIKNVLAARALGLPTRSLVDRHAAAFRELVVALGISADDFLRTTEPRHRSAVQAFWQRLRPADVYRRYYHGLYCVGCEDFVQERDLVNGNCPEHAAAPTVVAEENWFFRLSAYQRQIEDLLASGRLRIVPETRRHEVLAFVRRGLQDISVSRTATRTGGWGVPVPGDDTQTIYVWIDALINYLAGPGFGTRADWDAWWNGEVAKTHVIGKNVWKFHAVYWPALLLSAGLPLPDTIVVHGFLTVNGQKISKSLGNGVDPFDCIREFGADAVRYYLLRAVPPAADGDFAVERLKQVYHTELANGLGNLVSRLTALAARAGLPRSPYAAVPAAPEGYHEALRQYQFDRALATIQEAVAAINQEIDRAAPWKTLKAGDAAAVRPLAADWLRRAHGLAYWLAPFLPQGAAALRRAIEAVPLVAAGAVFARLP